MARYEIYTGKFPCHTCKVEVTTLRMYPDTKEVTWMCPDKHMSRVLLISKKTKKDYEREG
jgi:deoxycytidylate deaminase